MSVSTAHAQSYYAATAHPYSPFPCLEDRIDCDVCVIGGGLTGCTTALELAERGFKVALLEARRIGWGASGRNGGQVIAGYACDLDRLQPYLSSDELRAVWDMSIEAIALVKGRIARHDIDCDWRDGQLHAAVKPRHADELRAQQDLLERHYGYRGLELWDRAALMQVLATERYCAGLYDANSGHLHPLNYTLGLARAADAAGVRIFEDTAALALERAGTPVVRTGRGRVHCRYVVLAGNAYLLDLVPALRNRIMPVGTYVAATEPLGEDRARALIRNRMAVTDINFVLDYFRTSADHRMLFGGRVSYSTRPPVALASAMRRSMLRVFPQLRDVRMDYAWGGFVDITISRAPDFGRLGPDCYYAQGFSGHGLNVTALAGRLLAEAIAGTAGRFDLFTRIRHHDFPGGRLLRTPLLVLAMLYYRLRDLL